MPSGKIFRSFAVIYCPERMVQYRGPILPVRIDKNFDDFLIVQLTYTDQKGGGVGQNVRALT